MIKKLLTILTVLFLINTNSVYSTEIPVSLEDPLGIGAIEQPIRQPIPESFKPYTPQKDEVIFSDSKKFINSINPNSATNRNGSYFPGSRGVNQLVIYTPTFGVRTGTNEFGTEAIVEGNVVSEISGADSIIPEKGIVISGHGTAKSWMNSSIKVGTKIYVDSQNNVLYAYTTSDSFLYETEKKIEETETMINYYKSTNDDYNWKVPTSYLDDAKDYLKKAQKNPEQVQKFSKLAIDAANDAIKSVIPYKSGELKGVWIRPTEKSEEEIVATIHRLKETGIDNIFLETYFHGKTIFPSRTMQQYNFTVQNEAFVGFDPLRIWINEAHKHNMKVHIWFESFYVGNQNPKDNPNSILSQFPSWGNKTKKEADSNMATKSVSEHNGYFIDPANSEVQDFLAKLLNEIIVNYKPDGINLDYIRYPQAVSKNEAGSWGYTQYARDEFKTMYGEDPLTLTRSNPLWTSWENYRRGRVTNFVRRISMLARNNNVYLSAVIFPDRQQALESKQQDWKTWSTNGYIKGLTPLFLTCDSKTANAMMSDVIRSKAPATDLYAGLFVAFMNGSEEDLIRQIHEARKLNAKGVIIFDYAHLSNKYATTLSTSVFAPTKVTSTKFTPQTRKPQNECCKTYSQNKSKGFWIFK